MVNKIYRNMWAFPLQLLVLTLIITFLIVSAPIFLIFLPYRLIVWLAVKTFRKDLKSFVSGQHVFFVTDSPEKSFSNMLLGIVIKGDISSERVCQLFQERVLNLEDGRGNFVYQRLKYTWTNFMGYSFWKQDSNFLVSNHVRDYDYQGELLLHDVCKIKDLERVWVSLMEAPWKKSQSPWELLVLGKYCQEAGSTEHHTLILFRINHIHCDVYSIIGLCRVLFQSPMKMPQISRTDVKWSIGSFWRVLLAAGLQFLMVLSMLFKKKRLGRRTSAGNMRCSMSSNISVDVIKSIKNRHQVSFSTAVLTALQGAVARAIRSAGYDPPTTLDIGYVVPLRNHPGGLNINANLMLLRLPCNHRTYHERMMKIDKIFKTEYALLVQLITYWMRLSALLPSTSLQSTAKVGFGTFGPCIALSITPTLLEREYVDGREIVDVFTGASMSLGIGMLINCGGVNGKQRFTFHFDKSVFRDEASAMKIAMFFEEELTALNNLEPFPQSV